MPWAIRLHGNKTTEVCCSYGKHRGTVVVRARLELAYLEQRSLCLPFHHLTNIIYPLLVHPKVHNNSPGQ